MEAITTLHTNIQKLSADLEAAEQALDVVRDKVRIKFQKDRRILHFVFLA